MSLTIYNATGRHFDDKAIDNSGNGGIIKLKINMFDKSTPIYLDALNIEEEKGFEDICLHGSSTAIQTKVNNKLKDFTAKEFTKYLREETSYNGGNIRLASCSSGKGENSFAQQLSKELNVTVKAPDDDLYYADDHYFVGSPYRNVGKWRIFKNGDEIE